MRTMASGPSRPRAQSISSAQRHSCLNLGERLQAGTIESSRTFESSPACGMCHEKECSFTFDMYYHPFVGVSGILIVVLCCSICPSLALEYCLQMLCQG